LLLREFFVHKELLDDAEDVVDQPVQYEAGSEVQEHEGEYTGISIISFACFGSIVDGVIFCCITMVIPMTTGRIK
jgi:hypothetical protein